MATENTGVEVDIGVTENKMLRQLARLEAHMTKAARAGDKVFANKNAKIVQSFQRVDKSASRASTNGLRNVGLQLSQVSQQGGVTGNYMQALAIQLPDLLLGFGTLGIFAGVAAGALIPLASNLGIGSSQADILKDALKLLGETADDLKSPMDILSMQADELAEKYGEAGTRVREFALAQAELAATQAERRLADQASDLGDVVAGFITSSTEGRRFEGKIRDIQEAFVATRDEAIALEQKLEDIYTAEGFAGQQEALQALLSDLREMGIPLKQIPEELQVGISNMITLSNEADRVVASLERAAAAAMEMSRGVPLFLQGYEGAGLLPDPVVPDEPKLPKKAARPAKTEVEKQADKDLRDREALFKATRTEAEAYAIEMQRLNDLHARGAINGEVYNRAVADLEGNYTGLTATVGTLQDATTNMFASVLTGSKSAKEAVADLLNQFAAMAANKAFSSLLDPLFSGIGSGDAAAPLSLNARGNVFSGGKVQAFANGGVVSGPTMFPMAKGAGLMGEAGPEAIMPLKRGADGKLGVAGGGGGGVIEVVLAMPEGVTIAQSRQISGEMSVQVSARTASAQRAALPSELQSVSNRRR